MITQIGAPASREASRPPTAPARETDPHRADGAVVGEHPQEILGRLDQVERELKEVESRQREIGIRLSQIPGEISALEQDIYGLENRRRDLERDLNNLPCLGYLLAGPKPGPVKDGRAHELTLEIQRLENEIAEKRRLKEQLQREENDRKVEQSRLEERQRQLVQEQRELTNKLT